MKRYRIIIIGAITLLIAIFIGFTVRINMIFPNAKDVTYTSDNPPIIDGLKITPVDYNVYTIDEYREKSGQQLNMREETARKSRIVVMTIELENVSDKVVNFSPSIFVFLSDELNAHNGVTMYSSKDSRIVVVPGEKKEVRLQCTLGSSMVKESKLDKIDSSDISLVYSFYPKRLRTPPPNRSSKEKPPPPPPPKNWLKISWAWRKSAAPPPAPPREV